MAKNNSIYIWRIVFTYLIAIYHFNNAFNINSGWYIGVEFFFIVSGYLLMEHISNGKINSPWKYTLKRVLYFFPICLIGSISRIVYNSITNGLSVKGTLYTIFEYLPDFCFMYLLGGSKSANAVVWYINALLVAGVVIIYFVLYHKRVYINIIAPFSAIVIYGALVKFSGCIEGFGAWNSPFLEWANYLYLLRGFAGLSIGVLVWVVTSKIRVKERVKILLLVEVIGYLAVLILSYYYGRSNLDLSFLMILVVCVGLSFTNEIPEKIVKNPIVRLLNSISIYIYINHYLIRLIYAERYTSYSIVNLIGYCVIITIIGIVEYFMIESIKKVIRKIILKRKGNEEQ